MSRATRWAPLVAVSLAALGAIATACGRFEAGAEPVGADAAVLPEAGAAESSPPPPACTEVDSDPANCGKCGHSCLGGACTGGVCQPFVLGRSSGELVIDVAVDAKRVLWMTAKGPWGGSGHVYACPKGGVCASPVSLANPDVSMGNLAADDTNAFVSYLYGSRAIKQILPEGTLTTINTSDHPLAVRLQERNGHLFFLSLGEKPEAGTYAASVYEWTGTTEILRARYDSTLNYNDFTVAGDDVFAAAYGQVARCSPQSCVPFTTQTGGTIRLTTDGKRVIWSADVTQDVRACDATLPTCPAPLTLVGAAQLKARPLLVTVVRGTMYVTTAGSDIFACDPSACAKTLQLIAHDERLYAVNEAGYGSSVTADDPAVYWAGVEGKGAPIDAGPDGSLVENTAQLSHRIMMLAK